MIVTLGPATIPGLREAGLDLRAVVFAGLLSIVAAVLAGVVPALRVMTPHTRECLSERGAGEGTRGIRIQQALVVGQVALAMALLVTAGLLVESVRQMRTVDPGFRPERVVTGKVVLPIARWQSASSVC